jgi:hypothetical protein
VVAPVTAVCAVTIPVVVGIAPGERPTMLAILGVHLAIVAIVLVSQSGHNEEGRGATTGLAIARGVSVSLFTIAGLIAREKLLPRRESLPIVMGGGVLDIGSRGRTPPSPATGGSGLRRIGHRAHRVGLMSAHPRWSD